MVVRGRRIWWMMDEKAIQATRGFADHRLPANNAKWEESVDVVGVVRAV